MASKKPFKITHPGKLTAEVGGPPSKNPGKVAALAAGGDKAALLYKNVFKPASRKRRKNNA